MKRELVLHPFAYTILIGGLLLTVLFAFVFWPEREVLRLGFAATGLGYVAWGIWIHRATRDLNFSIAFEYVYAASLAVALLWLVTI